MAPTCKRICVYCGSSTGNDDAYVNAAVDLGQTLLTHNIDLVYGGANRGLMGILANAVINGGGNAIGVMPQSLVKLEAAHEGLTALHVVSSMHERKSLMEDLSDGFIALPGGLGTFEELFEIWTWAQLGFHRKPVALLNVNGFYDELIAFLNRATQTNFIKPAHRNMLLVESSAEIAQDHAL